MTLDLPLIAVLGLACYRATRLITHDQLTETPRLALYRWAWDDDGAHEPVAHSTLRSYVYVGVTCAYCLGVWCALALTWAVYGAPWSHWHGGRWLIVVLAVAGVQALATTWKDSSE